MRISSISIKMIILALVFYLACYYASISSERYRTEKEQQVTEKSVISFTHIDEVKLNHWDYAVIAFLVLGISSTVAAIWVRKFDG